MSVVVDASALLQATVARSANPRAASAAVIRVPLAERFGLAAPTLLAWEVGNVVHRKRAGSYGSTTADRAANLAEIIDGVELVTPDRAALRRTGEIAERSGLTFYDAAYIELAARDPEALLLSEDAELVAAGKVLLGGRRALDAVEAHRLLIAGSL